MLATLPGGALWLGAPMTNPTSAAGRSVYAPTGITHGKGSRSRPNGYGLISRKGLLRGCQCQEDGQRDRADHDDCGQ
jgi:hypothetical protein